MSELNKTRLISELKKTRKVIKKLKQYTLSLELNIKSRQEAAKYEITEQVFYNKELSDAIRYVVILSPCTIDQAIRLFSLSKDFNRDKELVKKLLCHGVSYIQVLSFITCINS